MLAEESVEVEADEEIPEAREVVEGVVTPDEELVVLNEDVDAAIEDVVAVEADIEELKVEVGSSSFPSSAEAEFEELEADEDVELLTDMLMLMLILILIPLELNAIPKDEVDPKPTELNLPGSRLKCVSLSSVPTSLPATFLK